MTLVVLSTSCGAITTNATPSTIERSPHAEALALVMETQQEVIQEVEKECPWWFDTMTRNWNVKRPVAPGLIDSTHMFTVTYTIDEDVVAIWSVNTNPEYKGEKVELINSTPKSAPDLRAEREKKAELTAVQMFEQQKDLNAFKELFEVSHMSAKYGSSVWLYFNDEEWSGDFIPKTNLPCRTMAELIFPINSNDVVEVGLSPKEVTESLEDLIKTPFIRELIGENGRIRLRAAGDRFHWDSEQVEEYMLILTNNGFNAPPLKTWTKAIIDLPDSKKMISISHPRDSELYIVGQFDLVKKESWRKEYLKITGNVLDESSPYIDKKYCPVVNRAGTLQLLKRATDEN